MRRRFFELAAVTIAAVALLTNLPAGAQPNPHGQTVTPATPVAKGNCQTNYIGYKVSKTNQTTTSTTFVDVIDMTASFQQAKQGCAVVSFSAEASAAANETMHVQVVLDGTILCQPSDNFFVTSNATATGLADRAMNYVCTGVAPGGHNVKVQFRSGAGGLVDLDYRTIAVHYLR